MKKAIFFIVIVMVLTLSGTVGFANNADLKSDADKLATPATTENILSQADIDLLTRRVEEIRDMDKTDMTVREKRELKNELRYIDGTLRNGPGYIYVGSGTIILIIILLIILL